MTAAWEPEGTEDRNKAPISAPISYIDPYQGPSPILTPTFVLTLASHAQGG